jgi:glycosyltransferase involved in cell wall biosynthesis
LITVSDALRTDIEEFSGCEQKNAYVVPNVVDAELFFYDPERKKGDASPVFFMLNYWRRIKSPFVLFEAFRAFLEEEPGAVLRVGGYGPLWEEMERYVHEKGLEERIQLIGRLSKGQVASEMQNADAFVHAASYETFSVVSAEALCCGTPVGVTHLPALTEFIHEKNGVLVREGEDWRKVFSKLLEIKREESPERIAKEARESFSAAAVGERYYNVLKELLQKAEG